MGQKKEKLQHNEPSTLDEQPTHDVELRHHVEVYKNGTYTADAHFDNAEEAKLYYENRLVTEVKISLAEDINSSFSIHWHIDGELKREFAIENEVK